MNRIDLYIGRTLAQFTLAASFGLVGFFVIFTFLEQLEDIRNNYTVLTIAQYVGYSVPRMFYETLPFAVLIGSLAGLGLLAGNSELVVMRASGVSTWRISAATLKPALVFVIAGMLIGETVLPRFETTARLLREHALEGTINSVAGYWYRQDGEYMHFETVDGGQLGGVSRFQVTEDQSLQKSLWAESATFVPEDGGYWELSNVVLTSLQGDRIADHRVDSMRWDINLTPEILNTDILVEPSKMSMLELRRKIDHLSSQGLNTSKFELGFWSKIFQPVATLALVFVAISFIFGPLREATMGMRVVSGLVTGIVFKFVQDLLAPASLVFGFPPVVATLLPILICIGLGTWLLRRTA